MLRFAKFLGCCLLTAALGCNGASDATAPVSGKVTLDGAPLANAQVRFLPKASEGSEAGLSSSGTTDAEGRFSLTTVDGAEGAMIATHEVRISTLQRKEANDGTDNVIVVQEEKVPARYSQPDALTFTVPAGGSDQANFALESK